MTTMLDGPLKPSGYSLALLSCWILPCSFLLSCWIRPCPFLGWSLAERLWKVRHEKILVCAWSLDNSFIKWRKKLELLSILKMLLRSWKLDDVLGLIPSCKYLGSLWRKVGIWLAWARTTEAHRIEGSYLFSDWKLALSKHGSFSYHSCYFLILNEKPYYYHFCLWNSLEEQWKTCIVERCVFLILSSWEACAWSLASQEPVLLITSPREKFLHVKKLGEKWWVTYVFLLVLAWLEENKLLSSLLLRHAKDI